MDTNTKPETYTLIVMDGAQIMNADFVIRRPVLARRFFVILLSLFLSVNSFSQTREKEYFLLDRTDSADINKFLFCIVDAAVSGIAMLDNVFKPVIGHFSVHRFLATYQGLSYAGRPKEFHDIIILKTDKDKKILDAFQYTLEWAERPSESDLYRMFAKEILLTNKMNIRIFLFLRSRSFEKNDRSLKDSAIIKMD